MKLFRSLLAIAAIQAFAVEPAAASGATSTVVPDSTAAGAEAPKKRAPKNPDNLLDIVNGRLPLPLVKVIRFAAAEVKGASTAEIAKNFGTSVGKVFDIAKNRNFSYVDAGFKPSTDEVEQAKKWFTEAKLARSQKTIVETIGQAKVDAIMKAVTDMGIATAEELAARPAQRTFGAKAPAGEAQTASAPAAAPGAAAAPAPAGGGVTLF